MSVGRSPMNRTVQCGGRSSSTLSRAASRSGLANATRPLRVRWTSSDSMSTMSTQLGSYRLLISSIVSRSVMIHLHPYARLTITFDPWTSKTSTAAPGSM